MLPLPPERPKRAQAGGGLKQCQPAWIKACSGFCTAAQLHTGNCATRLAAQLARSHVADTFARSAAQRLCAPVVAMEAIVAGLAVLWHSDRVQSGVGASASRSRRQAPDASLEALLAPRAVASVQQKTQKCGLKTPFSPLCFAERPFVWCNRPNFLKRRLARGSEPLRTGALC